jgi:hypothetical protein
VNFVLLDPIGKSHVKKNFLHILFYHNCRGGSDYEESGVVLPDKMKKGKVIMIIYKIVVIY